MISVFFFFFSPPSPTLAQLGGPPRLSADEKRMSSFQNFLYLSSALAKGIFPSYFYGTFEKSDHQETRCSADIG